MKKILLFVAMAACSMLSFAQADYGEYSLPHTTDLATLNQYVGQRVKVMDFNGYPGIYSNNGHDEYIFKTKLKGTVGKMYTIKKVKVGPQIVLTLADDSGAIIKAKINANGEHNYKGMQSCKSFFLVDKFEGAKNSISGKKIKNMEGTEVATYESYSMAMEKDSYPVLSVKVKSDLDDSRFTCRSKNAEVMCRKVGTTLTNPMVKASYQIVGVTIDEPSNKYDKTKYYYNVKNSITGKITKCEMSKSQSVFDNDLSGKYVSTLSKVEKPSNPAIRYGKTTVVEDDKKVSKYSYVDNVIDILIFGTSQQFNFILKNVSDNSIKVIWNEAVFVNYDGSTSKIMHVGTKYSQREGDQPATTIIKGAKIEDLAAPNCNVRYSDVLKDWITDSMYPSEPATNPGQLRLMLPIQIKDVINEYIFVFDVNYLYNYPERLNIEPVQADL